MKAPIAAITTFVTALACNACCWLPPLLIALGAGTGLAAFLAPYHSWLLGLAAVQLSWGFYAAYRPHHSCQDPDVAKRNRRFQIAAMWVVGVLVVGLNLVPHTHEPVEVAARQTSPTTVELSLGDLHCQGCAKAARETLAKVSGVRSVDVRFAEKKAVVQLDEGATEGAPERLKDALRKAGIAVDPPKANSKG